MEKNIAQRLVEIAETTDSKEKEQLKEQFERDFKSHHEWKILEESLKAACAGRKKIGFGRNSVPPQSLNDAGFHLEVSNAGFDYCFG